MSVQLLDGVDNSTGTSPRVATQVVAGDSFSCAVTKANTVKCWGDNSNGVLGVSPSSLASSAVPVTVAMPTGTSTIRMIAAGDRHVCVVADPGSQVLCWGNNENGQLGDLSMTSRTTPRLIRDLGSVRDISAGGDHTCVRSVVDVESIDCWGDNGFGQIGTGVDGDGVSAYTSPQEISILLPPALPSFTSAPAAVWVNSALQTFVFRALDGAQCKLDKGALGPCGSSIGGVYTLVPKQISGQLLTDGQHSLTVQHSGAGGSSSRRIDWKIDTSCPTFSSNLPGGRMILSNSKIYGYRNLSFGKDLSGPSQVEFSNATKKTTGLCSTDVPVALNTVNLKSTVSAPVQSVSVPTKLQSTKMFVRVKDRAGNWSRWYKGY